MPDAKSFFESQHGTDTTFLSKDECIKLLEKYGFCCAEQVRNELSDEMDAMKEKLNFSDG